MIIGFTGTQTGLVKLQIKDLIQYLLNLDPTDVKEFHHGDCIGADKQAHHAIRCILPHTKIVIHPPIKDNKRAFCDGDVILEPKEYLDRNKDIVDASDHILVAPKEMTEQLRSGTWSTYRYAKKLNKRRYIFYPQPVNRPDPY